MTIQSNQAKQFLVFALMLAIAGSATLMLNGCGASSTASEGDTNTLYTCGMHPQVVQNHPGNCPICGMTLTPIRKQAIAIDPATVQTMGIRTAILTRGPLRRVVRTVGAIDFDETALAEVSTKFRGWVEKLYVDSTGKQMHRGEPLFEIYSPELYLAQTEYLVTLAAGTNSEDVATALRRNAAMSKLRYWDISDDQIAELERSRTPKKTLRMNAPRDGIVVEKTVVEGQMVEPGMRLYRLADIATVWIQAQVYEQDLPFIRLGQEAVVTLPSEPGPKFRGRVTYIYPTVDEKTRTARVRMEFHNPGYFLKPGMYATVEILSELSPAALLVPDMAVLRSGQKNTVFVALAGGHFEPRTVALGASAEDNFYEVLAGLTEGERVVTSGQFMLDSESQLREAIQKMQQPGPSESNRMTSMPPGASPSSTATNPPPTRAQKVVYICPMPEHVSLEYDHPGECPLCGMTLVPVSPEMLARIQPGGSLQYYTCPMLEHSDVHEKNPGKCPRCGMTLIPVMLRPKPAALPGMASSPGSAQQLPLKLYTCPMAEHVDIVSDHPGQCPKCGMKLVETSQVNHGETAEENWRRQHAVRP